jgi:hypothetical protein
MNNLAGFFGDQGKEAEEEALYREVLAIGRRIHGSAHANTLTTISNLGACLLNQGQLAAAERL